jgi:hypothetical protein
LVQEDESGTLGLKSVSVTECVVALSIFSCSSDARIVSAALSTQRHKIFLCFMNRLAFGIHVDSIKSSIFMVTKTKFNSTT